MADRERIVVTAAVIERDGAFLLTRRLDGTHLAGHWEFPGGRIEPGETVAILGATGAGKSTLINRLLGEERLVAFDQPGTTRDSVYVPFERDGQTDQEREQDREHEEPATLKEPYDKHLSFLLFR